MPIEIIGEFGTPGASLDWLDAQAKLTIRHVTKLCGDPPPEMRLEIVWQEHELGNYPTIGLVWDDPMRGTPWNYISRCEVALAAYENGGELPPGWTRQPARSEDADFDDPFPPDKPPPEPPDIVNVFETERYISKLIQWGLEASQRERSRPHLVEKDEDGETVRNEAIGKPISCTDPGCLSVRATGLEELDAQHAVDTTIREPQGGTPDQKYLHQFLRTLMKYANDKISQKIK